MVSTPLIVTLSAISCVFLFTSVYRFFTSWSEEGVTYIRKNTVHESHDKRITLAISALLTLLAFMLIIMVYIAS
jgi:hypothetical protein